MPAPVDRHCRTAAGVMDERVAVGGGFVTDVLTGSQVVDLADRFWQWFLSRQPIFATMLGEVGAELSRKLTPRVVQDVLALIPDTWLGGDDTPFDGPDARRNAYAEYLDRRLQAPHAFLEEAIHAVPV